MDVQGGERLQGWGLRLGGAAGAGGRRRGPEAVARDGGTAAGAGAGDGIPVQLW